MNFINIIKDLALDFLIILWMWVLCFNKCIPDISAFNSRKRIAWYHRKNDAIHAGDNVPLYSLFGSARSRIRVDCERLIASTLFLFLFTLSKVALFPRNCTQSFNPDTHTATRVVRWRLYTFSNDYSKLVRHSGGTTVINKRSDVARIEIRVITWLQYRATLIPCSLQCSLKVLY